MPKTTTCSVADCGNPTHKRGYCSKHYQKALKYGDPLAGITKYATPAEALAGRSTREGGCLLWGGNRNQKGYGRLMVDGRLQSAHRVAYALSVGPIPEGAEVDHACLNRACVEPAHLRLATRSENAQNRAGANPNSKSGVRNVHKRGDRWVVRLKLNGKHKEFGVYDTIEEAEKVAIAARAEFFPRA